MPSQSEQDDWTLWWDARMAAMESVLGPADDTVGHATISFDIGADLGGAADIVYFRRHVDGVGYATFERENDAEKQLTHGET